MDLVGDPLIQHGVLCFQGCLMGRLHGGLPPAFGLGTEVNHSVTEMSSSDIDQIGRSMLFVRRSDERVLPSLPFRMFGLMSV